MNNHRGGIKSLRESRYGHIWLRTLERFQGVSIPGESDGNSELRTFLEFIFHSRESFNIRVEMSFNPKVELAKGRVTLDAMQSYAARFAATLDDWIPKLPVPDDRTLNKRLVGYFYKGIEPEPLRTLVQHFRVDHVYDVFQQFRDHCTASVVAMVNLQTEKSFRELQFRAR